MDLDRERIQTEILPYLPEKVQRILLRAPAEVLTKAVEIRLRASLPLLAVLPERDCMFTPLGDVTRHWQEAFCCTAQDVARVVQAVGRNSLYALEEELRTGFLTMEGGHRIGLAGQAVLAGGAVQALKHIGSINIRVAREIKHASDVLLPFLFGEGGRPRNLLVISPPRCGKTTLLRDIARNLSDGFEAHAGLQVGVVDERSEIAACKDGQVTVDLGCRTDVLDRCPKAEGILMLIRSMAPDVVVTDELGRREDAVALMEALHAGVGVVASAHGADEREVALRPHVGELVRQRYFDLYAILSDKPRIGTIARVSAAKDGQLLYAARKGGAEGVWC